jgi:hypothetical protein
MTDPTAVNQAPQAVPLNTQPVWPAPQPAAPAAPVPTDTEKADTEKAEAKYQDDFLAASDEHLRELGVTPPARG